MERFRFLEIRKLPKPEFHQPKRQTKISSLSQTNTAIVKEILEKNEKNSDSFIFSIEDDDENKEENGDPDPVYQNGLVDLVLNVYYFDNPYLSCEGFPSKENPNAVPLIETPLTDLINKIGLIGISEKVKLSLSLYRQHLKNLEYDQKIEEVNALKEQNEKLTQQLAKQTIKSRKLTRKHKKLNNRIRHATRNAHLQGQAVKTANQMMKSEAIEEKKNCNGNNSTSAISRKRDEAISIRETCKKMFEPGSIRLHPNFGTISDAQIDDLIKNKQTLRLITVDQQAFEVGWEIIWFSSTGCFTEMLT